MPKQNTIEQLSDVAVTKIGFLRSNPLGFFVSSMLAGSYIGFGIALIFTIGHVADPSWRSLAMGACFGIALTLVVFAGAELFTGHVMYMTIGVLQRRIPLRDLAASWAVTWTGNLAGAFVLCVLLVAGGTTVATAGADYLNGVAAGKMNGAALALFARAILCNWLVCLALWMSVRTASDTAKCIVIFWCLLAFIASGFEHSVANMAVFGIALLTGPAVSDPLAGMAHNLFWVTLGNIVSGCVFVSFCYWLANRRVARCRAPVALVPARERNRI
ncbi:MAG: nitrite transporter NirC [Rhodospirillaceae bacterium]|nr:nitrite transporter NirC [Rhodospirillaceae bacterium]MYH35755.1 nitrite transporter NirC [Rhodospirillaceae bacterium]MYK14238.1 nitrite transporter NirC [Rhodospirillaceae bacterium]